MLYKIIILSVFKGDIMKNKNKTKQGKTEIFTQNI